MRNNYTMSKDGVFIEINHKGNVELAMVSREDLGKLLEFDVTWCIKVDKGTGAKYVTARQGRTGKQIMLHRFLTDAPEGKVVDHWNGNTLNNMRDNLRVVTQTENNYNRSKPQSNNTSGVPGVSWSKKSNKWHARVKHKGKSITVGWYEKGDLETAKKDVELMREELQNGKSDSI